MSYSFELCLLMVLILLSSCGGGGGDSGGGPADLNSFLPAGPDEVVPTYVSISSPTNNSNFNSSSSATISVSGSCDGEGQSISLYRDTNYITQGTCSSSSFSLSLPKTSLAQGSNSIIVVYPSYMTVNNSVTVNLDSVDPIISISSALNIDLATVASYAVSGTCSENTQNVSLDIGALNFNQACSAGTFNFTGLNISSEGDSASLSVSVSHSDSFSNTGADSTTVIKDTVIPTVAITSSPSILIANYLTYTVSGTCSDNGQTVNIDVGGVTDTPVCSASAWSSTFDVSAALEGSVTITADLDDSVGNSATQASLSVTKDVIIPTVAITFSPAITNANVTTYSLSGSCDENGQTISLEIGSLSFAPTCSASAWSAGPLDVSANADNPTLLLTADISDTAGNPATQASTTVVKNTAVATVAITVAVDIDQSNVGDYNVSGTCSENGVAVTVNVGAIAKTPNCSSGTWDTGTFSATSLPDGIVAITADHSTATQASTTVNKDLAVETVTISSSPDITAANETNYNASGTCSSNTDTVSVSIDILSFTPTCSSGTWAIFAQDVSSIGDGSGIVFTADHVTATQAATTINKSTTTPTVSGLSVTTTLVTTADLGWSVSSTGGFTIDDYEIQYRVKGSPTWLSFSDGVSTNLYATVTGLSESTIYEFQVRVQYDTSNYSAYSNTAEGETKPDDPIFGAYAAMNVGGSTASAVVAYEDATNVTLNGVALVTLNQGQTHAFASSQYDVIDADKPIFTAGKIGTGGIGSSYQQGNIVWQPTSWAGKTFSFNAVRANPQELYVYAIEDTTIEVYEGAVLLDSATITAGNGGTLTWSNYGSYQVNSTGNILAYHISRQSGRYYDPKPLMPLATEIIGFPSNSMTLTTSSDGTNYSLIHANSSTATGSLNKADAPSIAPQGGSASLYQGNSLIITADKAIAGASFADSNGYCAAPFIPTSFMKTKYATPVATDFIAFASKTAGTIAVVNSAGTTLSTLTLVRSGANTNAPYRIRHTGAAAGTRFIATTPVAAWYQPSTATNAGDDDETVMYGTND